MKREKPVGDDIRVAAECLRKSRKIAVFSGAGVSAESGIGTFRDDDGLWSRFPPEEFAHWQGLMQVAMETPHRAAEFLVAFLRPVVEAQPNAGHRAIAELESHRVVTIITQNVDGLHELAGSKTVYAIHGNLYNTVYLDGTPRGPITRAEIAKIVGALDPLCQEDATFAELMAAVEPIMGANDRGPYLPKLVLFGDQLAEPDWTDAQAAARACDCMLVVGASGAVYPAATLPTIAREGGATIIGVDPRQVDADLWLKGAAGTILPELISAAFD